jgi:hypothetical protein
MIPALCHLDTRIYKSELTLVIELNPARTLQDKERPTSKPSQTIN